MRIQHARSDARSGSDRYIGPVFGAAIAIAFELLRATPTTPVTLAFGGDVHGEGHVRWTVEAGRDPFEDVRDTLAAADIAIVNLETVIGDEGEPLPKRFVYRSSSHLLSLAADAGIDVVNVANNHAFDYGREGFEGTLEAIADAGLTVVGGGIDRAQAEAPALLTIRGTTIAVLGMARVELPAGSRAHRGLSGVTNGFADRRMREAVTTAATQADAIVVTVHMGQERSDCPTPYDRRFVKMLLDAGATIIVGHHPHRVQGFLVEDDALVAYSIGNFVFDARTTEGRVSGVLEVAPDGTLRDHRWRPASIEDGQPSLLRGEAAAQARAAITDPAHCTFGD